jgi:hypothetical protein
MLIFPTWSVVSCVTIEAALSLKRFLRASAVLRCIIVHWFSYPPYTAPVCLLPVFPFSNGIPPFITYLCRMLFPLRVVRRVIYYIFTDTAQSSVPRSPLAGEYFPVFSFVHSNAVALAPQTVIPKPRCMLEPGRHRKPSSR